MTAGKKQTAQNMVYKALEMVKDKLKKEPLEILETAVRNASPLVEVKARRIGGATYQVPVEVEPARQTTLALRWLVDQARHRQGKDFTTLLSEEIINAYNNSGEVIKKKEDLHKLAEANRAFIHYARF